MIEWKYERGLVVVEPGDKPFLSLKGVVKIGKGDIKSDIKKAGKHIAKNVK